MENEVQGDQGPELDDVQQFEPDPGPVKVDVSGPVNARILPAVDGRSITKTLNATEAVKLISPNEFRGRVTLVADDDVYVARTKGEAEANVGKVPAGAVVPLAPAEWWAKGRLGAPLVSLFLETWTH